MPTQALHSMFWAGVGEIAGPGPSPGLRISASRYETLGFREEIRNFYRFWKVGDLHYENFQDPTHSHMQAVPLWKWLLLDVDRPRSRFLWIWSQGFGDVALTVTQGQHPVVAPHYQNRCRSCGQLIPNL